MSDDNKVLLVIYEARKNGEKVFDAFRKTKMSAEKFIPILENLKSNGLIESNDLYHTEEVDENLLRCFDAMSVLTPKGINYLEEKELI